MKNYHIRYDIPGLSQGGLQQPNPFPNRDLNKYPVHVSYNGCGICEGAKDFEEGKEKLLWYLRECLRHEIEAAERRLNLLLSVDKHLNGEDPDPLARYRA